MDVPNIQTQKEREKNIFHKKREISILTMKKNTARLTLLQKATESPKLGKTKQTKNKNSGMNNSQSHTCSGTINSRMYDHDFYHNFPTDCISSLQWVKASEQHQPTN
jgi:hypothetical protein